MTGHQRREPGATTPARRAGVVVSTDSPDRWLAAGGRIVLAGPPGVGKAAWVTRLADALDGLVVMSTDPGLPTFGPPCALARGYREVGSWQVESVWGLATLDAIRFRLPIVTGACYLARDAGPMVIIAPGVHRGHGAAELIAALAEAVGPTAVLWVGREPCSFADAIGATGTPLWTRPAPGAALSDRDRRRERTRRWRVWMADAVAASIPRNGIALVGTGAPAVDRVAAVLGADGQTLTLGRITSEVSARFEGTWVPSPLAGIVAARVAADRAITNVAS